MDSSQVGWTIDLRPEPEVKWEAMFMLVRSVGSRVHILALPLTPCVTLALKPEKWIGNG